MSITSIWSIATNLAFTEVEHFTYPNLRLVGLLFFILLMFLFLRSTLLMTLTMDLNMSSLEFWLSLFAVFFAWFVAFPASMIMLDFDLAIMPERLVYSPGYQRAWTFNPITASIDASLAGFTLRSSSLQLDQYLLAQGWYPSSYTSSACQGSPLSSNPAYMQTFNKVLMIPPMTKSKFMVLPFDVTHSSGPYAFGIKLDAIPGSLHLTSTMNSFVKGLHSGFCFEPRGEGHSSTLLGCIVLFTSMLRIWMHG